MIWFLVILSAAVVAVFFIPLKFTIYTSIKGENIYTKEKHPESNVARISLKVLGIIPIYVYDKQKREARGKNSSITIGQFFNAIKNSVSDEKFKTSSFIKKIIKWIRKVKFRKLSAAIGFNTEDYIKNAYINASLNTIICMLINANQQSFNFDKLYYQVSISDYNYYLNLDTYISFSLFKNIDVFVTIIKFIFSLKKESVERGAQEPGPVFKRV